MLDPNSKPSLGGWTAANVLAIGPQIIVPAISPQPQPMQPGLYWCVAALAAGNTPESAYNAVLNQHGTTPFLSIAIAFLDPASDRAGYVWHPADLLVFGPPLSPPSP